MSKRGIWSGFPVDLPSNQRAAASRVKNLIDKVESRIYQIEYIDKCLDEGFIPKSIRVDRKKRYVDKKVDKARRRLEICTLKADRGKKKGEISKLKEDIEERVQRLRKELGRELGDRVIDSLCNYKDRLRKEHRKRLEEKERREAENRKTPEKVKVIGEVVITKEEKDFLELGKNFAMEKRKNSTVELVMDVEEILGSEENIEREKKDKIRDGVRRIIERTKRSRGNLSRKERIGYKRLKEREDIRIMQADKGGAVAVMEKDWYEKQIQKLADDKYEEVGEKEEEKFLKERKRWFSRLQSMGTWDRKTRAKAREREWEYPVMMGFPKLHKEDHRLRPVLSGRKDPKKEIENILKVKLKQLLEGGGESRGVKNTEEAVQKIERAEIGEGRMFSLDIKAMFPSLKRKFVMECVERRMEELGLREEWVLEAIEWFLENSFCRIGEKTYRMKEGLPIGASISPGLAELVMREWVREAKEIGGQRLKFLTHYVDDSLGEWKGDSESLREFKVKMEREDMGIELELVEEKEGRIQFLDIELIRKNNRVERRWYQKDCQAGVFCHARSAVGESTKRNMIKGLLRRIDLISTGRWKKEGEERLLKQLKRCGYKEGLLKRLQREARTGKRNSKGKEETRDKGKWKGVSYHGKVSERIRRLLKKEGHNVYFKNGGKTQFLLRKTNEGKKIENLERKGVVYRISCGECEGVYIGETGRKLGIRMKEHERDVKRMTKTSAPFKHWEEYGHTMKFKEGEVLIQEPRENPRRLLEGIAIELTDQNINFLEGRRISKCWGKDITKLIEEEVRTRLK